MGESVRLLYSQLVDLADKTAQEHQLNDLHGPGKTGQVRFSGLQAAKINMRSAGSVVRSQSQLETKCMWFNFETETV